LLDSAFPLEFLPFLKRGNIYLLSLSLNFIPKQEGFIRLLVCGSGETLINNMFIIKI
jgi:hypothetical protein